MGIGRGLGFDIISPEADRLIVSVTGITKSHEPPSGQRSIFTMRLLSSLEEAWIVSYKPLEPRQGEPTQTKMA